MKSLFVLLFFVVLTQAIIEWPFRYSKDASRGLSVDVLIGYPPQEVMLDLIIGSVWTACASLTVNTNVGNNSFKPSASSTFQKIGDNGNGTEGADDFIITLASGERLRLYQKFFYVAESGDCKNKSVLPLTYTVDRAKNVFLDSVFKREQNKTVVIVYDSVPKVAGDPFTGMLTFAGFPDHCSNWRVFNEIRNEFWDFGIKKVTVGKFSALNSYICNVNFDSPNFQIPGDIYDNIADELDVVGTKVPCDSKKDVVLSANEIYFHITPKDYVGAPDDDQFYCHFNGYKNSSSKQFLLPNGIFDRYCMMLDFETKAVHFGDKFLNL